MKHYITKTEAINQAILPALGNIAGNYDLDGLANATFTYEEGKGFTQTTSAEDFWQIAPDHELILFVTWDEDTHGSTWAIMTDAGAVIETGETLPADDKDRAYGYLEEMLELAGYDMDDIINNEDNVEHFAVMRAN